MARPPCSTCKHVWHTQTHAPTAPCPLSPPLSCRCLNLVRLISDPCAASGRGVALLLFLLCYIARALGLATLRGRRKRREGPATTPNGTRTYRGLHISHPAARAPTAQGNFTVHAATAISDLSSGVCADSELSSGGDFTLYGDATGVAMEEAGVPRGLRENGQFKVRFSL